PSYQRVWVSARPCFVWSLRSLQSEQPFPCWPAPWKGSCGRHSSPPPRSFDYSPDLDVIAELRSGQEGPRGHDCRECTPRSPGWARLRATSGRGGRPCIRRGQTLLPAKSSSRSGPRSRGVHLPVRCATSTGELVFPTVHTPLGS